MIDLSLTYDPAWLTDHEDGAEDRARCARCGKPAATPADDAAFVAALDRGDTAEADRAVFGVCRMAEVEA